RVERVHETLHRFRRQRRIEPADRQRQVLLHTRVVVFCGFEGFHQCRSKRVVGADFRIRHQTRQLVRRRPTPIGPAIANFGQVLVSAAAVVGEKRTESQIHADRYPNNGQRNQEKLNGQGGSRDQWISSRGFALDEFVHEWDSDACPGAPASLQVLLRGSFSGQAAAPGGSGLASAGGQTNPLVLSLSKDEPWDARGSTGSPRAWEPISARTKLDHYPSGDGIAWKVDSPGLPRFLVGVVLQAQL